MNEIYAVFPRKQDAVRCCYRLNEDKRATKAIYRLENGLYEYTGPAHFEAKHFYIGMRASLEKNGFEKLLKRWDSHTAQLLANEKRRKETNALNFHLDN
jgi:hypothetical protein